MLLLQTILPTVFLSNNAGLSISTAAFFPLYGSAAKLVLHSAKRLFVPGVFCVLGVGGGLVPHLLFTVVLPWHQFYVPPIERVEPKLEDVSIPLEYCIEQLKSTGFKLQGKLEDEIDSILSFCLKPF